MPTVVLTATETMVLALLKRALEEERQRFAVQQEAHEGLIARLAQEAIAPLREAHGVPVAEQVQLRETAEQVTMTWADAPTAAQVEDEQPEKVTKIRPPRHRAGRR